MTALEREGKRADAKQRPSSCICSLFSACHSQWKEELEREEKDRVRETEKQRTERRPLEKRKKKQNYSLELFLRPFKWLSLSLLFLLWMMMWLKRFLLILFWMWNRIQIIYSCLLLKRDHKRKERCRRESLFCFFSVSLLSLFCLPPDDKKNLRWSHCLGVLLLLSLLWSLSFHVNHR